jgi:hypothetical protein
VARARTLWEEGTEPGRQVVVLGFAVALTVAVLDLLVTEGLSLLFDLVYVALCVVLALLVRPSDFFTVGVLPPLLMLGVFWMLGLVAPGSIADGGDGTFQAALTGLAHHSTALLVGYALCLACLAMRRRVMAARQQSRVPRPRSGQDSKRSGSPAPRRTTVGGTSL